MSYALFCFKHFLIDLLVSRIFIVYLYRDKKVGNLQQSTNRLNTNK